MSNSFVTVRCIARYGLVILIAICGGSLSAVYAETQVDLPVNIAQNINCATGPETLSAEPVLIENVVNSLKDVRYVKHSVDSVSVTSATLLSGQCVPLVKSANMINNLIGLTNGDVYQINSGHIQSWPSKSSQLFGRPLPQSISPPKFRDATFLNAIRVETRTTSGGAASRYAGLWKDQNMWIVVDFTIADADRKAFDIRPLFRSKLPLRSVSYFPAPDTRSGNLYVIQAIPSGQVRAITLAWWHAN